MEGKGLKFDELIRKKQLYQGSGEKGLEFLQMVCESCRVYPVEGKMVEMGFRSIFEVFNQMPPSREGIWVVDSIVAIFIERTANLQQISRVSKFLKVNLKNSDPRVLEISYYALFNKISQFLYQELQRIQNELVDDDLKEFYNLLKILRLIFRAESLSYNLENFKDVIQIHIKSLFSLYKTRKPEIFFDKKMLKITQKMKNFINLENYPFVENISEISDFFKMTSIENDGNQEIFTKTYKIKRSSNFNYYRNCVENEIRINNSLKNELYKNPEVSILPMIEHKIKESNESIEIKLLFERKPRDLSSLVQTVQNGSALNSMTLHEIFKKLLSALEFIHSADIVHRDLKPENILIGKNDSDVFIIDFGISLDKKGFEKYKEIKGTDAYIAPEIIEMGKQGKQDLITFEDYKKADIFSLGLVLAKLIRVGNKFLGPRCNRFKNFHEIQEYLENIQEPMFVKNVLREMLKRNPDERKSIQELFCNYMEVVTKTFTHERMIFIKELNENIEIYPESEIEDLNVEELMSKLNGFRGNELVYAFILILRKLRNTDDFEFESLTETLLSKKFDFKDKILNLFDNLFSQKLLKIKNPSLNLKLKKSLSLFNQGMFLMTKDIISININTFLITSASYFQNCDALEKIKLLREVVEVIQSFEDEAGERSEIKNFYLNEVKILLKESKNFSAEFNELRFLIESNKTHGEIDWKDLCLIIQKFS